MLVILVLTLDKLHRTPPFSPTPKCGLPPVPFLGHFAKVVLEYSVGEILEYLKYTKNRVD